MKAFLTGSRVYGTPSEDSDIDLVVCMSEESHADLIALCEDTGNNTRGIVGGGSESIPNSIKFGKLNLLICTSKEQYKAWVIGTKELKAKQPVTREEAVTRFKELRKEHKAVY